MTTLASSMASDVTNIRCQKFEGDWFKLVDIKFDTGQPLHVLTNTTVRCSLIGETTWMRVQDGNQRPISYHKWIPFPGCSVNTTVWQNFSSVHIRTAFLKDVCDFLRIVPDSLGIDETSYMTYWPPTSL